MQGLVEKIRSKKGVLQPRKARELAMHLKRVALIVVCFYMSENLIFSYFSRTNIRRIDLME